MIREIVEATMNAEMARRLVGEINHKAGEIGNMLRMLHDQEGWRALEYQSWTEFLESEFSFSRKHLYDLMRAAPVQERLVTNGYGEVPTSQAVALTRYPESLQMVIYETVKNHGEPITADRIEAMGDVLLEIEQTGGYVTTPDGDQTAFTAGYKKTRGEQEINHRNAKNILDTTADIMRPYTQDDGDYIVLRVGKGMASNIHMMKSVRLILKLEAAA